MVIMETFKTFTITGKRKAGVVRASIGASSKRSVRILGRARK